MDYMNIKDKEDDRLVIRSLGLYYSMLSEQVTEMLRGDLNDPIVKAIDKNYVEMERINLMLARWVSPENE